MYDLLTNKGLGCMNCQCHSNHDKSDQIKFSTCKNAVDYCPVGLVFASGYSFDLFIVTIYIF